MERGSITKWLLLGLAIFFLVTQGKSLFGSKVSEKQILLDDMSAPATRAPEQICTLSGPTFRAELSTAGASLRKFVLSDHRFESDKKPMDLVTTARESRMPLRTDLRLPEDMRAPKGEAPKGQVAYDDLDWKLQPGDGKSCVFTFEDATTSLKKTVSLTDRPYELAIELDVKNLGTAPKKHRFAIEQTGYQKKKDVEGGFMSRPSEHVSETVAVGTKVERHSPSDFEPGEFKKPEFTPEHWRRAPGPGQLAAVSNVYFTKLLSPQAGQTPAAETLIEDWWNQSIPKKEDDPNYGYLYRARLAYPEQELAPGASATYKVLAFAGPKERDLLASVSPAATEVQNLGTFVTIARGLVWYLNKLYSFTRSWGLAIVLLTITVRLVLFPLSLSQIKSSMAMRKLKPEMDEINEKYKDDAAQRGLAIQELWRKNGVSNPVIGCLPMLLQMPVWWALYTALQTAVQLYHVPFLWFPDLTAPDRFFIIPIVLGASSFLQQKLMPAQGDPQQQKMMLYMMPAIFTFMMLFLPVGLGVYMLTNSLLAIAQQLLVERYLKTHEPAGSGRIEVREKR
ncbi:Inner membrane protein translocase component YidC, long form [Minicystis rosea]|nr:Inner membrane protein translocase component YidC, long form [Minicystis rosea]